MAMVDRDAATLRVIEELKRLYKIKILPLEQMYRYDLFHRYFDFDLIFVLPQLYATTTTAFSSTQFPSFPLLVLFILYFSPVMTDAEFDSKPQVMLVGQYSVGGCDIKLKFRNRIAYDVRQ